MRTDSHHSFSERYPLDHLESILKRNRFEGSILVGHAPAEVPEFVRAIVARSVLTEPDLAHVLDQLQRNPKFRGVQHDFAGDELPEGLGELERRNLTLDAWASPALVGRVVERHPGLRIVIDHLGQVPGLAPDLWARDLAQVSAMPQVFGKLSGVHRFLPTPRMSVHHALGLFGPGRLMFGSDWPCGLPDVTWKGSLAAFTQAIGAQPIEVREQLLGGTAERFYGL